MRGDDLHQIVKHAFMEGAGDSALLDTLIVLIPEVEKSRMIYSKSVPNRQQQVLSTRFGIRRASYPREIP